MPAPQVMTAHPHADKDPALISVESGRDPSSLNRPGRAFWRADSAAEPSPGSLLW
jgi:hypothetical protein